MATVDSYQYRPLRYADSIRLLQIVPNSNRDAEIQCILSSYRLSSQSLTYEALSYTWGDCSDMVSISIGGNNAPLQVTQNCFDALKSLRLPDSRRTMWVDAICINQEDIPERSSQVRIMDRIFGQAIRTIVYLGEETPGSQILFRELVEAAKAPEKLCDICGKLEPDRPPPDSLVAEALDELVLRPWFRRVWVLQEAYVSKSLSVMCGATTHMPCSLLRSCMFGYSNHNRITKSFLPFVLGIRLQDSKYGNAWRDLWKHLYNTREFLASDARDRIFALKALLDENQEDMNHMINYSTSTEELFSKLATLFLDWLGLRLLVAARHPHNRRMASWVPDWSQNLPLDKFQFRYLDDSDLSIEMKKRFSLQPNTTCIPGMLCLQGWRVGSISELGNTFTFHDHDDAAHQHFSLAKFIRRFRQQEPTASCEETEMLQSQLPTSILTATLYFTEAETRSFLNRGPGIVYTDSDWVADGFRPEPVGAMVDSLQSCRIFIIGDSFIGIAPEAASKSDILCIMKGSFAPCLLRQRPNGGWLLISGDCYAKSLPGEHPIHRVNRDGVENWDDIERVLGDPEEFHIY